MKISKSVLNNLFARGALLLLGLLLFLFYIYPPLLLFFKSQTVLFEPSFFKDDLFNALINSLYISAGVFLISSLIGGMLAWLVIKTNLPLRRFVDNMTLTAFAVPPYILALSWMQLCGRNGYLERAVRLIHTGTNWHPQPYSTSAVIVVMSLHLYPLMYMSIRNALEQIDPEMEKAALLSGASGFRVTTGITLPMIFPNLLTTGLLVFSRTMANFAVPALLCLPVGIEVIPTRIYSSLSSLKVDEAAALSLLLVAISTSLYLIHGIVLNRNRKPSSVGCSSKQNVFKIGKGFSVYTGAVIIFFVVTVIIPFGSMILSSFLKRWGLPLEAQYFTLNNYREIFRPDSKAAAAFVNSISFGVVAALLASVIGTGAAIAGAMKRSAAGRLIEAAASWPMAIPNTVLAVAAIFAWSKPPLRLYGTPWAIIITYMVLFTPIIMKQVSGLIEMQDIKLLKASRTMGASAVKTFFYISLPLLLPGFRSGMLLCIMIALREIPIALMLYSAGQETVGILLFGMQSQSYGLEMTSALAVIIMAVVISVNMLLDRMKKDK